MEALYWKYRPDAVRLGYLLTQDEQAAEDIAQEAFIRVFARLGDLRHPDSFLAYLRRTVTNLSRDFHRKADRERAALQTVGRLEERERTSWPEAESGCLLRAVLELPHRQSLAIILRHCEGLSERETADVLQSSVSAVKSLTNRGLAALRRNLEGNDVRPH